MTVSARWRELIDERLEEAVSELGAIQGVRGLVLAGSVGRGEPWPLSDIDMLPISADDVDVEAAVRRVRAVLVDRWSASGRAQCLDISWLRFSEAEVKWAVDADVRCVAERMIDPRWLHGIDKPYGGKGVADPGGIAATFVNWATEIRFHPVLIEARIRQWQTAARDAHQCAVDSLASGDDTQATI